MVTSFDEDGRHAGGRGARGRGDTRRRRAEDDDVRHGGDGTNHGARTVQKGYGHRACTGTGTCRYRCMYWSLQVPVHAPAPAGAGIPVSYRRIVRLIVLFGLVL